MAKNQTTKRIVDGLAVQSQAAAAEFTRHLSQVQLDYISSVPIIDVTEDMADVYDQVLDFVASTQLSKSEMIAVLRMVGEEGEFHLGHCAE